MNVIANDMVKRLLKEVYSIEFERCNFLTNNNKQISGYTYNKIFLGKDDVILHVGGCDFYPDDYFSYRKLINAIERTRLTENEQVAIKKFNEIMEKINKDFP